MKRFLVCKICGNHLKTVEFINYQPVFAPACPRHGVVPRKQTKIVEVR